MKAVTTKELLLPAVTSVCRILPARTSLPVLAGFLVTAKEDKFILQGTDLELSITVTIPAHIDEEGSTVVIGRYFNDLLRRLADDELKIMFNENTQQLDVFYGRSFFSLNTWLVSDYPVISSASREKQISIKGSVWKNIIKKVLFAAAPQDVRPNYAGVLFQLKTDKLVLVSTDTYRLALYSYPFDTPYDNEVVFIPARALNEVNRLLREDDNLEIFWDQKFIGFQTEYFILTTRLIESQFPSYEKVITSTEELKIEVERVPLMMSLERASLFVAPPDHYAITELKIEDNILKISAYASQVGSLLEEINIKTGVSVRSEASFNTRFLLEPLKVMESQDITLCLNGSSGPAIYREEGDGSYIHLVLPVCKVS